MTVGGQMPKLYWGALFCPSPQYILASQNTPYVLGLKNKESTKILAPYVHFKFRKSPVHVGLRNFKSAYQVPNDNNNLLPLEDLLSQWKYLSTVATFLFRF